jgi:hypothetical protein
MTPGNKASQRDTVLAGQTVCGACGCHPARSCRPRSRCACTPTSSATNSPKAAFHDRKGVGKSSRTVCHQSWAGRYSTAAHKRQVPCSGLAAVVARLAAKRRGIMGGVSELIVVSGPPGAGKTTAARTLSQLFDPSALVPGDQFFAFIELGGIRSGMGTVVSLDPRTAQRRQARQPSQCRRARHTSRLSCGTLAVAARPLSRAT